MKRSTTRGLAALLLSAALTTGCGDDPFQVNWVENPNVTTIYSLDRDELNRPAGFNMAQRTRVIIEGSQTDGRWDFAVDRQGGEMVLLPPRALGVNSTAGIVAVSGAEYDEVREAPADTLQYVTDEPVVVDANTIYIVRTYEQPGQFGQVCQFYGRVEPLTIDLDAGVFVFRHDTSPDCNNRRLVPPGT